jgi:2,3-bisphosphoglycerate-independent phosphoglycerate mutase
MSAEGITDELLRRLSGPESPYELVVLNFANPDMVGHTGVWDATIEALEFVDGCLARIVAALPAEGLLCITADHGNADEKRDEHGNPMTAHSLNPVPIVLIGRAAAGRTLHDGILSDVAPTLLELVGVPAAEGMTGRSLLDR